MNDLVDWTGEPINVGKLAAELRNLQIRPEVIDEPRGVILEALLFQAQCAYSLERQVKELKEKLKKYEEG